MSTLGRLPRTVTRAAQRGVAAYRRTGADLPFGDLERAHPGVAMEGYFWRVTDAERGRVLIALAGINQGPDGPWATLGLASTAGEDSSLSLADPASGWADRISLGVVVDDGPGTRFFATRRRLRAEVGDDLVDLTIEDPVPWPRLRFGGSSYFQSVPGLNQYWHPWLLGGRAVGYAVVGGERWEIDGEVYAERNWGREGFPESWWWGQAHGFGDGGCVAFAGGQVHSGPLRTEVTALVAALPGGEVVRLGNPVTSPVAAEIGADSWSLSGSGRSGWEITLRGAAPLEQAHVLPVPLPSEQRQVPGAIEHLAGSVEVSVWRRGVLVWEGRSELAGLEHGGLEQAAAELRSRGHEPGIEGAAPR